MAKVSIEESTLTGIADAIRSKYGASESIPVEAMALAISAISSEGDSLPSNIVMGSFVPQTDTTEYDIGTPENASPVFACVFATNNPRGAYIHLFGASYRQDGTEPKAMTYTNYQGVIAAPATNYDVVTYSGDTAIFKTRGGSYVFKTGAQYMYFIYFKES